MPMRLKTLTFAAALALAVAVPSAHAWPSKRPAVEGLQTSTFRAVDQMAAELSRRQANPQAPLLVASAQDLDDLGRSERLGRLIGELVASAFSGEGYLVQEVRLRDSLRISSEGEHLLSRDLEHLESDHLADVVITSTYALAGNRAYITIKAVRLADGLVISSRSIVAEVPRGLK